MKITKLGHSCLLIEQNAVRILIDPGVFSAKELIEKIGKVDALLITHSHRDHLDIDYIVTLVKNMGNLSIYADSRSVGILKEHEIEAHFVEEGEEFFVGPVKIIAQHRNHDEIYGEFGIVPNVGFGIDDILFITGDSFTPLPKNYPVLALPIAPPWTDIKGAIDFAKQSGAKKIFPVHDGYLANPKETPFQTISHSIFKNDIEFTPMNPNDTINV